LHPNLELLHPLERRFSYSIIFLFNTFLHFLLRAEQKLCRLPRRLFRKTKGSRNGDKAQVKGMLGDHRLDGSIRDAGRGEFLRQLKYKAAWIGYVLKQINANYPSSRACHRCGIRNDDLTLADPEWGRPEWGTYPTGR